MCRRMSKKNMMRNKCIIWRRQMIVDLSSPISLRRTKTRSCFARMKWHLPEESLPSLKTKFKICVKFSTSLTERSKALLRPRTSTQSWEVFSETQPKSMTLLPKWAREKTPRLLSRSLLTSCSKLRQTLQRPVGCLSKSKLLIKCCIKVSRCSSSSLFQSREI